MSTVFGALFFIILVLMAFNMMLVNFLQYDRYNTLVTSMGLRDQQSQSEDLVVNAPGAVDFGPNAFNITVNNQGGIAITIARVYITNFSPTNSVQCQGASLCLVDPSPATPGISNTNIQVGESSHKVKVSGINVNDGSGYRVVLATTRGRLFSFFYPWPVNMGGGGPSNSNSTNTAHGALDVKFDVNSFNFTRGTQTVSQPGWTVPYATNLIYYVKVINNAVNPITISKYTSLYFVCYQDRFGSGNAPCNETDDNFAVDNATINPSNIIGYDDVNRPYVLPAAGPNGPTGSTIIKFGSACPGVQYQNSNTQCVAGTPPTPQDVDFPAPYLVFMGFFYKVNGVIVGQTISFVAIRACATYPSCP